MSKSDQQSCTHHVTIILQKTSTYHTQHFTNHINIYLNLYKHMLKSDHKACKHRMTIILKIDIPCTTIYKSYQSHFELIKNMKNQIKSC